MIRHLLLGALLLGTLALPAKSAPIQLIDGLPSSYTPGQPVTFDVHLPPISNLGSYNVDVVLESDTGIAGTDFYFDVAATTPAATNYVFPSSANFFDAANVDPVMRHRISLTDFDFTGVNVAPGTNDRVANVVFQTAPTFTGNLSLFVDADGLILDTPDIVPTPVPGFASLQADIAASGPIELPAVPEPASVLMAGISVLGALIWSRYARFATSGTGLNDVVHRLK